MPTTRSAVLISIGPSGRLRSMLVVTVLTLSLFTPPTPAQDIQQFNFEAKHRVNAHGNEFNGLAKSSDSKRLFIATEKGEIIVWSIGLQRVERTLRQGSAVHLVAALANGTEVLAAGSNHYKPLNTLVRKWNVETAAFVDLIGLDENSFPTALSTESDTHLAAVTTADGTVLVWDLGTYKQLATWKLKDAPIALALIGRNVYVATINREAMLSEDEIGESTILKLNVDDPTQPPAEFLRGSGRTWTELAASTDHRLLSATFQTGQGEKTLIIDPATKAEIGSFEGSASAWIDSSKLLLFKWLDPSEIVQIPRRGRARSVRQLGRMQADTDGRAFDLTGQVTSVDGSKAWASYRKGPGLLEFDLSSNKIRTLIEGPSGAYAISVLDSNSESGKLLTGGADGYVRLWKLADLSLIKEFHVAASGHFVTDVHLMAGGRRAVVGVMRMRKPTEPAADPVGVLVLDLETGQQTKVLDLKWPRARIAVVDDRIVYPEADSIKLTPLGNFQDTRELKVPGLVVTMALSENNRWVAVIDDKRNLSVFDLQTHEKKTIVTQADASSALVITNDGGYVYQIAHEGRLTRWDINTGQASESVLSRIQEMHSNVDFMTLANDDQWLLTAGNHGDVGIFDRLTGRLLCYTRTSAAGFWVEKVWSHGNRMIFTTDTGVLFEGNLVENKH